MQWGGQGHILLTDEGETSYVGSSTASDLISDGTIGRDLPDARKKHLIEHFISMGFFHFRIKKYIEIRVADSVPLGRALSYVALIKGLIYSEENLEELETVLADINSIEQIEDAIDAIIVSGLDTKIYGDRTAREWYNYLLELANKALTEKEREYLNNV